MPTMMTSSRQVRPLAWLAAVLALCLIAYVVGADTAGAGEAEPAAVCVEPAG